MGAGTPAEGCAAAPAQPWCLGPATGGGQWNSSKSFAAAAVDDALGTLVPNAIGSLPTHKAVPFEYPALDPETPLRRAWSRLDPKQDATLIQDVGDAYRAMNSLPDCDPRSLIQQTWMHDFYCGAKVTDIHNTWTFLPWHRAFLYFHEQILGSLIGKPNFRLPYWDWEVNGALPKFFDDLGLPAFLTGRAGRVANLKETWADPCVVQAWLLSRKFADFVGSAPSNNQNSDGLPAQLAGQAYGGPHSMAHAFVGGAMFPPATAAADPLFYAHHANVDRFWAHWQHRYGFPPDPGWDDTAIHLYDSRCRLIRVCFRDMARLKGLNYSYESFPSVSLCDFDHVSFSLIEYLTDARRFVANLRRLTLGAMLSAGVSAADVAVKALTGEYDYRDFLKDTCFSSFLLQTVLTIPTKNLQPGKYYLVALERDAEIYKLGGFGLFASPEHLHMKPTGQFFATGCVDHNLYTALQRDPNGFQMVYGVSVDGNPPFAEPKPTVLTGDQASFTVLFPKGYLEMANKVLQRFGIE